MEEAKVGNKVPINQQSLITMDDMFIQIGKLHIDKVNSDKIIDELSKQLNARKQISEQELIKCKQELEEKLSEAHNINTASKASFIDIKERLKKVEESNKLYQDNNLQLVNKIQQLNNIIQAQKQEVSKLKTEVQVKAQEIAALKEATNKGSKAKKPKEAPITKKPAKRTGKVSK